MKAESYQKLIRRDERIRKTVGITGFFEFFELFPLAYQIYLWCLQVANKGHFPAVLAINCA